MAAFPLPNAFTRRGTSSAIPPPGFSRSGNRETLIASAEFVPAGGVFKLSGPENRFPLNHVHPSSMRKPAQARPAALERTPCHSSSCPVPRPPILPHHPLDLFRGRNNSPVPQKCFASFRGNRTFCTFRGVQEVQSQLCHKSVPGDSLTLVLSPKRSASYMWGRTSQATHR